MKQILYYEIQTEDEKHGTWFARKIGYIYSDAERGIQLSGSSTIQDARNIIELLRESDDANFKYRIVPVAITIEKGEPVVD